MIFRKWGERIMRKTSDDSISKTTLAGASVSGGVVEDARFHDLATLYEDGREDTPQLQRKSLNDYQLVKVLGKGCMGKVLLSQERSTAKFYAIKSISKKWVLSHGQREVEHTLAEQRILAELSRIHHPFLISLHCSFQTDENLFLVMPFVNGGDLATQLALSGMFEVDRARFYCAEMVAGISELHRLGIIYRDLKPENVLLTVDGHIKLTDFGLSKQFKLSVSGSGSQLCGDANDCSCKTKTFCGTAEYLAPEILMEQPYSFEVDFWSLGTFLYEMLTGITPFWAENHAVMYRRVLEDKLEFPPELSDPNARNLIANLLIRNPRLRMGQGSAGSAPIMRHAFFASISWHDLLQLKVHAPYKPQVDNELDVKWFDQAFTALTPKISPAPLSVKARQPLTKAIGAPTPRDNMFMGYTYMSSSAQGMMQSFGQSYADTRHVQKKRRREILAQQTATGMSYDENCVLNSSSYEEESLAFRMEDF